MGIDWYLQAKAVVNEPFRIANVVCGWVLQSGFLRGAQWANLSGNPDYQRVGRNVATNNGARANEDIIAHVGIFQQHRVDADQYVAANLASVDDRAMGQKDVVAQFEVVVGVQCAVVLKGTILANDDVAVICSNHCAGPDTGTLANADIPYYVGRFADEYRRMNSGEFAVKSAYQVDLPSCIWTLLVSLNGYKDTR